MPYDHIVQEMQRMQEYSSILSFYLPGVKAFGGEKSGFCVSIKNSFYLF